jgi:hypothetical protein
MIGNIRSNIRKSANLFQIVWGLVRINQYFAYFLMAAALGNSPQCSTISGIAASSWPEFAAVPTL